MPYYFIISFKLIYAKLYYFFSLKEKDKYYLYFKKINLNT
jgi:hypothetical protein